MAEDVNLGSFSLGVRNICSPKDPRSHIEHDEDSITSGGASLEDSMFEDSVDTNAELPESDTCTSTDELTMRKQGAIPKALPPRPEPSPSKEDIGTDVLHNFNLLPQKSQAAISNLLKVMVAQEDIVRGVQHNFNLLPHLLEEMATGKVSLERCGKGGRLILVYEESRKKSPSVANTIVVPKTEDDIRRTVDECDEHVFLLKNKSQPKGFLLDPSKIKPEGGKYREGSEFKKKGELGKGGIAGVVYKVKDEQTEFLHCLKTVKLSYFRMEELKCMVDLRHTCYVPSLLMFRIGDDAVELHMEIVTKAITMRQIIEKEVWKLGNLREPFAFYTLCEMLKAVSVVQKENWSHNDLHDENFMMQLSGSDSLAVKVIDFGSAFELKNAEMNFSHLENETARLMIIFLDAFAYICFNDVYDMKKRWRECLEKDHQGKKVLDLVHFAMNVTDQCHFNKLLERVEGHLEKSLKDLSMTKPEFLRQVVAVLSTEKLDDGAITREEDDYIEFDEGKITALRGEEGDTNRENVKYLEEDNRSAPQELFPKPAL